MDLTTMTVEDIARRWAGALAVFNRHGIDICCGGSKTVREVALLHGLSLETLVRELHVAGAGDAVEAKS